LPSTRSKKQGASPRIRRIRCGRPCIISGAMLQKYLLVIAALCFTLSTFADDLIGLRIEGRRARGSDSNHPSFQDVIVQRAFAKTDNWSEVKRAVYTEIQPGLLTYWTMEHGLLWKRTVSKRDYRFDQTPEKLEAIRARWKLAGVSVQLEDKSGEQILLDNCSLRWIAPERSQVVKRFYGIEQSADEQTRRRDALPLAARFASVPFRFIEKTHDGDGDVDVLIPLREIRSAEFAEGGSVSLVMRASDSKISGRVRNELINGTELVPTITGFIYESSGALTKDPNDAEKLFFTERGLPFSVVRRLTVLNIPAP
jgi:hypothetical protein